MKHFIFEKNNSDLQALFSEYEKSLKASKDGETNLHAQLLPSIIKNRIAEKLQSGDLNQDQAKQFIEHIQTLVKKIGGDVSIQFVEIDNLKNAYHLGGNNTNESDNENNKVDTHLINLTPEEIFRTHIANASKEGAEDFFTKLCQAHQLKEGDINFAKNLFLFSLEAQKKISSPVEYDNFSSGLLFSNSIDLFNAQFNSSEEIENLGLSHFFDYLKLNEALDEELKNFDSEEEFDVLYFSTQEDKDEYVKQKFFKEPMNELNHVSQHGGIIFESSEARDEYINARYQVLELSNEEEFDDLFFDMSELEELENINVIIEKHNQLAEKIIGVFELNDNVKKLLSEHVTNLVPSSNIADVYHLIENAIFDGVIPSDKQSKIQSLLNASPKKIDYILSEQNIVHHVIQGLVSKDSHLFFAGMDSYVNFYLKEEQSSNTIETLSLNDLVVMFASDYFISIQNPKSTMSSCIFELIFDHYDEDIFKLFIERYKIPKNICLRIVDHEKKKTEFMPLIEFALFINNYHVADSLIKLGFGFEEFKAKIIEDSQVYNYYYTPLMNVSLFNESNLIYLIENELIDASTVLTYDEFMEEKSISVTNNIFFYLAYEQLNEAFIRLYEKTKQKDNEFTTKSLKTYRKSDLLSYYLLFAKNNNAYNFDLAVLDIFLAEQYVYDPSISQVSGVDLLKVLKSYDTIEPLVDVIHYLQDIFPPQFKEKKKTETKKRKDNSLIQWFDKTKLESHFKRIEKERDSANKEYIKHMLANNNHMRKNLIVEDESFFDTLQSQFPNFEEVINFYKSQFRLKKLSGKKRITPVLLLGDPGIGKTYFAKKLAENLNTGYNFVDMASLTSNWVLTGNNGTWKSAKQGKILEAMMNSNTINPIFLMDEIEKSRGGEYDPTMSLYQLLEEINAKSFTDEFVDFTFDASGIIYIACANTLGNLSEPLQTRFHIIHVPKPNNAQLESIVHNIFQEATKDAHIFSPVLSEDIMNLLKKETLRSIKVMIDKAVGSSLLEISSERIDEMLDNNEKITLELKHFKAPSKKREIGFNR